MPGFQKLLTENSDELKQRILAKAQAKRDARNARVCLQMWKGSPEHKYNSKPLAWAGNNLRQLKSYETLPY